MPTLFGCPICHTEFPSAEALDEHEARGHIFHCPVCQAKFRAPELVEEHVRMEHA